MAKQITLASVLGTLTATAWIPPKGMTEEQWEECGTALGCMELAVAWWIGDWWAYGKKQKWGQRYQWARQNGIDEGRAMNCGMVSRAFETSRRREVLSFGHHQSAMAVPEGERLKWLQRAIEEGWSVGKLRAAIAQAAAVAKTQKIELDAKKLGKFTVLYADPPWRYEHPPMGGTNRSIENHYPTMTLEEICAEPVKEIAHEHCTLFMWATSPKLVECMQVLKAWGFEYRTNMVWVKDIIGMGYHARERHELLLVAKLGELPPPAPENRPDSVLGSPRRDHSEKPDEYYGIIDKMYPDCRKVELFARPNLERPKAWSSWGNHIELGKK